MFNVIYEDDFKQKHLVIAKDIHELNFLKMRFDNLKITPLAS